MKLLKSLFAASALAGSVQANAAGYNVHGVLTSIETTVNTEQAINLIARATTTINTKATLTGILWIDAPSASVEGSLEVSPFVTNSYVEQYGEETNEVGYGTGVYSWAYLANVIFNWADNGYSVNPGSTRWDALTRTLTYTGTANNAGSAVKPGCSDSADALPDGFLCSLGPNDSRVSESLTMNLVFSEDMKSFTGVASITDYDERSLIDTDGDEIGDLPLFVIKTNYVLYEAPLPASAWLFGSALVGVAGVARRRV